MSIPQKDWASSGFTFTVHLGMNETRGISVEGLLPVVVFAMNTVVGLKGNALFLPMFMSLDGHPPSLRETYNNCYFLWLPVKAAFIFLGVGFGVASTFYQKMSCT